MNEVFADENYGRDHVRELIQEAQQERYARNAEIVKHPVDALKRAQTIVTNVLTSLVK